MVFAMPSENWQSQSRRNVDRQRVPWHKMQWMTYFEVVIGVSLNGADIIFEEDDRSDHEGV